MQKVTKEVFNQLFEQATLSLTDKLFLVEMESQISLLARRKEHVQVMWNKMNGLNRSPKKLSSIIYGTNFGIGNILCAPVFLC